MIETIIRRYEKLTQSKLDYLRKLRRLSPSTLLKFFLIPVVASPATRHYQAMAVAGLCGTLHDDCGECLKIGVAMAQKQRVPRAVIEAVVEGKPERLSPDLRLVYDLSQAALARRFESQELAREVERRLGGKVLADVAMQLAISRFYPTFKRALGEATTECLLREELFASG